MDTQVKEEEFNKYLNKIEDFIEDGENYIEGSIKSEEAEIQRNSIGLIDERLIQARRLSVAILYFLTKCKSGIFGKSTEQISEKLVLIITYLQGLHCTEDLILKGQYIKASAILKQDFEVMTRLHQINDGNAKHGKQPNVKHAPEGLRYIYGQLNDIAHISKEHILGFYLEREFKDEKGVSPVPVMYEAQMKSFYLFHIVITYEIVSEAIELYNEMYEIDENYKKARIYHKILFSIMNELEKEAEELIKKE